MRRSLFGTYSSTVIAKLRAVRNGRSRLEGQAAHSQLILSSRPAEASSAAPNGIALLQTFVREPSGIAIRRSEADTRQLYQPSGERSRQITKREDGNLPRGVTEL